MLRRDRMQDIISGKEPSDSALLRGSRFGGGFALSGRRFSLLRSLDEAVMFRIIISLLVILLSFWDLIVNLKETSVTYTTGNQGNKGAYIEGLFEIWSRSRCRKLLGRLTERLCLVERNRMVAGVVPGGGHVNINK